MWKNFLNKTRNSKKTANVLNSLPRSEQRDEGEDEVTSDDESERIGMYEVNHIEESDESDEGEEDSLTTPRELLALPRQRSQEKYEFLLSLISEPRFLVRDALTAEELKLTLKLQAFQLEKRLVNEAFAKSEKAEVEEESRLRQQMKKLNENLTRLDCRLEVLRSVQGVLPSDLISTERIFQYHTEDSLETNPEKKHEDLLGLLRIEKLAHRATQRDLDWIRKQYDRIREDLESKDSGKGDEEGSVETGKQSCQLQRHPTSRSSLDSLSSQDSAVHLTETLRTKDLVISELQRKILEMEREKESLLEVEAQKFSARIGSLEAEKEDLSTENERLKSQIHTRTNSLNSDSNSVDSTRVEPIGCELSEATPPIEIVEAGKLRDEAPEGQSKEFNVARRRTYKISNAESPEIKQLRDFVNQLQQKEVEYLEKIRTLENNQKNNRSEIASLRSQISVLERRSRDAESLAELSKKSYSDTGEELNSLRGEYETLKDQNRSIQGEIRTLMQRERESLKLKERLNSLERDLKMALEANSVMFEDLNRERVLRKKYYNTIEEMKGKIRVSCRLRPMTQLERQFSNVPVAQVLDSYSVRVDASRGGSKEFHFDRVYGPSESQEVVFEDAKALIQSAYDGYNVCICAYGQTGSGKTYTIIGEDESSGIAPRAFQRIFEIADEYAHQFSTDVTVYMVELHNDKLIDLLKPPGAPDERLEVKKDRKGVVWIQGCSQVPVSDCESLMSLFIRGNENRHTAFTKMNERSSRSHLVVGVTIECTNRLHGTKTKGKVSLLDLAGSERVAKSGVTADNLKETTFINKSLSALGDVISALTTEQDFIPYRNSKLTMLMQDSLGGNAKTLMFVNVSPAAYNLDETLISLTYASRVKQITNSASKAAESKEIARLKTVISKLRRGELSDETDYSESLSSQSISR